MGLKKNISSGGILALGNTLIAIISYPIFLKYLGAEVYGLWAILSIVVNFAAIGILGIDIAMIKYVAEENEKKHYEGIKIHFSTAIVTLLITGFIIFVLVLFFRDPIIKLLKVPEAYTQTARKILPFMVVLSVFVFLIKTVDGTLKGLGRVDISNYYNLGCRSLSVVFVIFLLFLGYSIWSLFWGQFLLYLSLGFLTVITIYKKLKFPFFSITSFNLKCLKKMIKFGGTMTVAQIVSMFLMPFNKAVISRYISLSAVTYFEISCQVVWQFRSLFNTSIGAIMPEISRLSVIQNTEGEINDILKKTMKLVLYLGVPILVIVSLFAPFVLRLWLFSQYNPDIAVTLRIISLGYIPNLISIPIYYLLMGIGKVGYCFINHVVQAVLNIIFVSICILFGITNLFAFTTVFSSSIALSAILLIILFIRYKKISLKSGL